MPFPQSQSFLAVLRADYRLTEEGQLLHQQDPVGRAVTGLDHVAAAHPRGINLPIGEMGEGVSGGQRQLVSLARSLLARPRLLLMDEPTSAMDSQTEALFLQHLQRATQGQTLVVVTHRPSLLALVDRVIVIDAGKVVADGPKATVMAALRGNEAQPFAAGEEAAQPTPTARPRRPALAAREAH
ncbi:ATP-binding cassette domain-containing protein [Stenotrophomonas sp. SY1]|uniref:ATP-binding cassette domain-containing protein n=1 Tax=Stenotrophomonas sp. SY1 TaxID=477235 RepID=UPI001E3B1041|nr:ATP-binding cassette domain-containing protein [Stenotrophomonas sp. SY1]MCD9087200.1 ATP-binding cassette domain-containing protein [Stenotrophomonas sp. SY1]